MSCDEQFFIAWLRSLTTNDLKTLNDFADDPDSALLSTRTWELLGGHFNHLTKIAPPPHI